MTVNDFSTMWASAIETLLDDGNALDSRVGGTREVLAWQGTLADPRQNVLISKARRMSPAYACGEMLWYLSGERTAERILIQAPSYERFLDDGIAWGAYGERWARTDQLGKLEALLREQPNTRQAILQMWLPDDLWHACRGSKNDLPCTLNIQFLVRAGRLHAITSMRSNDVWLGMPYDVFCFTTLQTYLAMRLGLELGTYTHRVGSLHIYDRDLKKIAHRDYGLGGGPAHRYGAIGLVDDALQGQLDDMYEPAVEGTLMGDLMYCARTKTRPEAIEQIANPQLIRALELYHDRD